MSVPCVSVRDEYRCVCGTAPVAGASGSEALLVSIRDFWTHSASGRSVAAVERRLRRFVCRFAPCATAARVCPFPGSPDLSASGNRWVAIYCCWERRTPETGRWGRNTGPAWWFQRDIRNRKRRGFHPRPRRRERCSRRKAVAKKAARKPEQRQRDGSYLELPRTGKRSATRSKSTITVGYSRSSPLDYPHG